MNCGRTVSEMEPWRSATMQTLSGIAGVVTTPMLPANQTEPPPPHWKSSTMNTLEAIVTPGSIPNIAVSLAVTTLLLPMIPNRFLAAAAGLAVGSILGK
jgi:hypothetical protein